jgi:D-amino peptidase
MSLIAGQCGIPVILVTGDDATCREAREFLGPDVVTASVKVGLRREGAILLPPDEARRRIRDAARQSITAIGRRAPYVIDLPIRGVLRFPDKETADRYVPRRARRADNVTFEAVFESGRDVCKF